MSEKPTCQEYSTGGLCGAPATYLVGVEDYRYYACEKCAHLWVPEFRQRLKK